MRPLVHTLNITLIEAPYSKGQYQILLYITGKIIRDNMSRVRPSGPPLAMDSSQKSSSKYEQETRLEDYLNDKFQTSADFGTLSSLMASVETQKLQLEAQAGLHMLNQ